MVALELGVGTGLWVDVESVVKDDKDAGVGERNMLKKKFDRN